MKVIASASELCGALCFDSCGCCHHRINSHGMKLLVYTNYIMLTLVLKLNQVPWQVPVRSASSIINFRQEPGFSLILAYFFSDAGKKSGPAQICQFHSARRLWFPSWARVLRIDSLDFSLEVRLLQQSQGKTSSIRNRVHFMCACFSIPQNKWFWYAFSGVGESAFIAETIVPLFNGNPWTAFLSTQQFRDIRWNNWFLDWQSPSSQDRRKHFGS